MTQEELRIQLALGTFDIKELANKSLNDFRIFIESIDDDNILKELYILLIKHLDPTFLRKAHLLYFQQRNIIIQRRKILSIEVEKH